jgi:TRAP-type C4-dicarboxylate transport system substrate-binding protein
MNKEIDRISDFWNSLPEEEQERIEKENLEIMDEVRRERK